MDVEFGPDGNLYILDFGRLQVKNGKEHVTAGTGRLLVVEPQPQPASDEATSASDKSGWRVQ
jgi:hypothetical protein